VSFVVAVDKRLEIETEPLIVHLVVKLANVLVTEIPLRDVHQELGSLNFGVLMEFDRSKDEADAGQKETCACQNPIDR